MVSTSWCHDWYKEKLRTKIIVLEIVLKSSTSLQKKLFGLAETSKKHEPNPNRNRMNFRILKNPFGSVSVFKNLIVSSSVFYTTVDSGWEGLEKPIFMWRYLWTVPHIVHMAVLCRVKQKKKLTATILLFVQFIGSKWCNKKFK